MTERLEFDSKTLEVGSSEFSSHHFVHTGSPFQADHAGAEIIALVVTVPWETRTRHIFGAVLGYGSSHAM